MLQDQTEDSRKLYNEKRNLCKTVVRRTRQESWNKFVSEIEHDIHGRQTFG